MRKNNRKLYESIMRDVARTVKKHLNESNQDNENFNMLTNSVMAFYNHLDSPIVQEFIEDNDLDYDELAQTQYDINWDNIKSLLNNLISNLNAWYNWDNAIASLIEYIFYAYFVMENYYDVYDFSWAEEEYPNNNDDDDDDDENFNDYGKVIEDIIDSSLGNTINKLVHELPEDLLYFIKDNLMDFFYNYEDNLYK